jgi:hypothetical protein
MVLDGDHAEALGPAEAERRHGRCCTGKVRCRRASGLILWSGCLGWQRVSAGVKLAPMIDTLGALQSDLADRYRIEREIGAGGMTTVYHAHDGRTHAPVADFVNARVLPAAT